MLDQLIPTIKKLSSVPVPAPESAAIVVQLLTALAGILKNMTPEQGVVESFQNTKKKTALWGLIEESQKELNVDAISNVINGMGDQMKALVPIIKDTLKDIIGLTKGLDLEQIKSLSVVGTILAAVSGLAGSLSESMKGAGSTKKVEASGAWEETVSLAPSIGAALNGIRESLPGLIDSIVSVTKIKGISDPGFIKNLDVVKNIFEFLGMLPALAKTISGSGDSVKIDSNAIVGQDGKSGVVGELSTIFNRLRTDWGASPLGTLIDSINNIGIFLKKSGDINKVNKVGQDLGKLFTTLGSIVTSTTQVATAGKSQILEDGLGPAVKAVQEISKSANELNAALADGNLNKLDIQAKLKNVASAAGLGGQANYSIQNKGVNITINMNVTMNADDLERSLVLRTKSIIRDKINLAGKDATKNFTPLPENPNAAVQIPGDYTSD